jgi:hypothetical protein
MPEYDADMWKATQNIKLVVPPLLFESTLVLDLWFSSVYVACWKGVYRIRSNRPVPQSHLTPWPTRSILSGAFPCRTKDPEAKATDMPRRQPSLRVPMRPFVQVHALSGSSFLYLATVQDLFLCYWDTTPVNSLYLLF